MATIVSLMNEVMKDVGAISKNDKNTSQGFNFRGIDSVINAVSPALRKHGIVVVPCVDDYQYESIEIGKNRTVMGHVKVRVTYTFAGPDGDALKASVVGEAMDAGDKATAKAMSVAFRTALLQSLCLPTDEVDPDAQSYERSEKIPFDTTAIVSAMAKVSDLETLTKIGSYIMSNKDNIEPVILESLRGSYKDAQSRFANSNNKDSSEEIFNG
jgi:ERF superfamily